LVELEKQFPDRKIFHENVKELLLRMGADADFIKQVVKRNLDDAGYLNQTWSLYNIPYLHIYETDDFVLKIHLFPKARNYVPGLAAHAIHHHNNYMLTTNAFFGSGYESMLFEKDFKTSELNLETKLKVRKHFHQKDWNPSLVDAWEPHIVFVPESLSATMLIWTPDKKRSTDTLRNISILKSIKTPLRKIIQLFHLESAFGIAKAKTYQFYPHSNRNVFMAIEENDYFSASKAAVGKEIDNYCMQILFGFIQKGNFTDFEYLTDFVSRANTPDYFKFWVTKILNKELIEDAFHRDEINIPQKNYTITDIIRCSE
jgi:hypothetical protein